MYEYADRQIKEINRRNLHSFDKLKTLKFDDLNVFRYVTTVYEDSIRFCKKRYRWIAMDAYIIALLLIRDLREKQAREDKARAEKAAEEEKSAEKRKAKVDADGMTKAKAEKLAEKRISEQWLDDMLNEADPVTMYRFDSEAERKKSRLVEALIAAHNKAKEIDKALRLWTLQTAHYADKSVDTATLAAYMDAGVEKVEWVTMDDIKVCPECEARDGKIYPIDKVPPKPHIRCRCELHPVV